MPKHPTRRSLPMLQRLSAILAVTAASYGLAQPQPPLRGQLPGAQPSGQHSPAPAQRPGPRH